MLLAFSGRKHSGKDSSAESLIKRHGFKRVGLADKLKDICSIICDIPRQDMDDQDKKELPFNTPFVIGSNHIEHLVDILETDGFSISDNTTKELYAFVGTELNSIRHILQFFGTDICRNKVADDMWLVYLGKRVKDSFEKIVITDARFANERVFLKKLGATLVLVKRPGQASTDSHVSENQLGEDSEYDVIINNDTTLDGLHSSVSMWYSLSFKCS